MSTLYGISYRWINAGYAAVLAAAGFKQLFNKVDHVRDEDLESRVKEALAAFLEQQKIRNDLYILEIPNPEFIESDGSNTYSKSLVIKVMRGMYQQDPEACKFVLKHHLLWMRDSTYFRAHIAGSVSALAAAFLFPPSYPALFGVVAVGPAGFSYCIRRHNDRHDKELMQGCTDEELKGGRRFYKAFLLLNIDKRTQSIWNRLYIGETGDYHIAVSEVSFSARIEKIEQELVKRRSAPLIDTEEISKIAPLKQLMDANIRDYRMMRV